MSVAGRYWHTLRHLRPIQFWGRFAKLATPNGMPSNRPFEMRIPVSFPVAPIARNRSMWSPETFEFLNERRTLLEPFFWNDSGASLLWNYNLHYFDDLNAENASLRSEWHRSLLWEWIEGNAPGASPGWDPYPTSLRIVNWIKFALAGNALSAPMIASLSQQARWLSKRIEWHLLGNHLLANAKALVFAGVFFSGNEADRLRRRGEHILLRELDEQMLPDGGHFERSPMYHAIVFEDVLDLINLAQGSQQLISRELEHALVASAVRMHSALEAMTHPDGEIAYFNDAAIGVAASPTALMAYATDLNVQASHDGAETSGPAPAVSCKALVQTGYYRMETEEAVAIVDVAPVGPDYLPGHAHADTLSFELSVFGQRMIVNGGTSCYGESPIRLQERKTAAHSTVTVDGEDSSEVWSSFRVARRAYPFGLELAVHHDMASLTCCHTGYRRLPGRPVHKRRWIAARRRLVVEDVIEQGQGHAAVAHFNLHPSTRCTRLTDTCFTVALGNGNEVRVQALKGVAKLESAHYGAEFGRRVPIDRISVDLASGRSCVRIDW